MLLTLDLGAVFALSALLSAVATLLLLTTWRAVGRPAYLIDWAGFCGLGTLAFAVQALRDVLAGGTVMLVATPAYLLAWTLFWLGCRRLRGAATPRWLVLPPLAAWYLACAAPAFQAHLEWRAAMLAALVGLLGLAAAGEVLRLRGTLGLRRAAWPLGLLNLVFATMSLARAVLYLAGQAMPFGGLTHLFGALLPVAIGFAGLTLACIQAAEREAVQVAAAAQREAAALAAGRDEVLRLHGALPALVFLRDVAADGTSRLLYRGGDMAAVTGWPAAALAGLPDLDSLCAPEVLPVAEFLRQTLQDGAIRHDWRMRRPDGSLHWMRTHARCLTRRPDGGAEVVGYVLNVDAERRAAAAAETTLTAARAQLERLHARLPAIVLHRAVEPDGTSRLLYRGGDIEAVTGWPAEALAGRDSLDHLNGPGAWPVEEVVREVLREGRAQHDWQMLRPDGTLQWMRIQARLASPRPDGGGEVVGYILNIDAEVQAAAEAHAGLLREAAALEAGRAQVERLLTNLPAVLFHRDCDPDGASRLLYRGGDVERVTGWRPEVMAATDNIACLREDALDESAMIYQQILREGSVRLDWHMRQPDGAPRWMRTHARLLSPRPDGGGEIVGYMLDISAEYAAAEAAQASRERELAALQAGRAEIERLHAGVPAVIFLRDSKPDGTSRLLYRGGDIEAVTGWPAAALAGTDDLASLRHDPEGSFDSVPTRLLQQGAVVVDWRMCQPDGPPRWMRTRSRVLSPRPDGGGEVVGYILDVSAEYAAAAAAEAAREREAAALLAGRAEVERLLAGLPAVIFLRDVAADGTSRLLYRTGDIEGVTGWPAEALATQETWRHLSGPDSPDFPAAYRCVLQTGEARVEWRLRRPDGSLQWMRSHGTRLSLRPDGSGEVAGYMLNIDRERTAETDLASVLEAAPLVVYRGRVAADGGFERSYLSRAIERFTGWPWVTINAPGGLGGLVHPDDLAEQSANALALLRDGLLILDQRMLRADGEWIWTRHTLAVVARDAEGGAEIVGFIVNVTAEHEAAAREQAARFELDRTLAAAPVAVLRGRIGLDGQVQRTFLSRGIEQLTGWAWEVVNPPSGLSRIIDPASRAALPDRLRQLLRDGAIRYDHRMRRADGAWVDVRSTLSVLGRLPDGSAEIVGFMADVTAERAAQAQAAAAGRLAALGEMGTGLAHELKQPLATISLAAENALRSLHRGDTAAVVLRLERITSQAQRAAGIIENLRRFARGSDPGAPPVAVSVAQAVDSVLALVGAPLREAEIEVELAFDDPAPAMLGQLVSLEQVLVNLLVNAADALRGLPSGVARRIRIAAAAEAGMVRLTVGDTGGGIPAEVLPRLFEPFVSTKSADHGTGLGLSICHGLVKAMGGTIEARNAAEGAVFTILLPQAVEAVEAVSPAA